MGEFDFLIILKKIALKVSELNVGFTYCMGAASILLIFGFISFIILVVVLVVSYDVKAQYKKLIKG